MIPAMIRAPVTRLLAIGAAVAVVTATAVPAALAQTSIGTTDTSPSPKTRARTPLPSKPPEPASNEKASAKKKDEPPAKEPASAKGKRGDKEPSPAKDKDKAGQKASGAAGDKGSGKPPAKASGRSAPAGLKASPVASFGNWSVFAAGLSQSRICYAISQPQQRLPKTLTRGPAFLFVTVRKADNVANEVALIMGFPVKTGGSKAASGSAKGAAGSAKTGGSSESQLLIGRAKFALVGKDKNAWLRDPKDEPKLVADMSKQQKLTVKAFTQNGEESTDEYSLDGFVDALKRTRDECK